MHLKPTEQTEKVRSYSRAIALRQCLARVQVKMPCPCIQCKWQNPSMNKKDRAPVLIPFILSIFLPDAHILKCWFQDNNHEHQQLQLAPHPRRNNKPKLFQMSDHKRLGVCILFSFIIGERFLSSCQEFQEFCIPVEFVKCLAPSCK